MSRKPFGPVPPEEFKTFPALPYGEAKKAIRKHDPTWGLSEGEKIAWEIQFTRETTEHGTTTVRAATLEEAQKIADALDDESSDICWEVDCWGPEVRVDSVKPKKPKS